HQLLGRLLTTCALLTFMLTILAFSSLTHAQDIFATPKSNSTSTLLLAPADEFLPVEEAFRLHPRLQGQQLLLTWQIADNYYLYEERFRFRSDADIPLD